jgi:hypothetical protein
LIKVGYKGQVPGPGTDYVQLKARYSGFDPTGALVTEIDVLSSRHPWFQDLSADDVKFNSQIGVNQISANKLASLISNRLKEGQESWEGIDEDKARSGAYDLSLLKGFADK